MKLFVVTALLWCLTATTITTTAQAHILSKTKAETRCKTDKCLLSYQIRNLRHVKYVATKGTGEPAKWHRHWVSILNKEIRTTKARVYRSYRSYSAGSVYEAARREAARYGVVGSAWTCLSALISRENGNKPSRWNPRRYNSGGSGAYGLPQALPGSKMASAGSDWAWNPATQIRWMIHYVRKYGGACGANYFQLTHNWY